MFTHIPLEKSSFLFMLGSRVLFDISVRHFFIEVWRAKPIILVINNCLIHTCALGALNFE